VTDPQQPAAHGGHTLKTWPEHFDEVIAGRKTFEIRIHDRDYRIGDVLVLREWAPPLGAGGDGERLAGAVRCLEQVAALDTTSPASTREALAEAIAGGYTGRECVRVVTHLIVGPRFGLEAGYCILSIAELRL
jgi:hypothetical protein